MFNEKEDIFKNNGIEITLENPEDFLKVKETLSRIGIASNKEKKLFQTCHILHKKGRYAILHFKELFLLDNRSSDLSEEDLSRRNVIVKLLHEWNLCTVVGSKSENSIWIFPEKMQNQLPINRVKIVPFSEKKDWELVPKYTIGKKIM
jgi:hypothetical protein